MLIAPIPFAGLPAEHDDQILEEPDASHCLRMMGNYEQFHRRLARARLFPEIER